MNHNYLHDTKIIKDYLKNKLDKNYNIWLDNEYINIRKDNSLLLLKLNYSFFNNRDILTRIYFYTYDITIYLQPDICYSLNVKLIPFSKEENYLSLSNINDCIISTPSKDKLKTLYNCIIKIFEQDEGNKSLLYKLSSSIDLCQ